MAPKSESTSIRSRFWHLLKNRRLSPMIIRIDRRKESKFTCKQSILREFSGLISFLKLLISIQELILIPELISFLESIMVPLPGKITIRRSIQIPEPNLITESIPKPSPESAPESTPKSTMESAPELIPYIKSEKGRSDSEFSPLLLSFPLNKHHKMFYLCF